MRSQTQYPIKKFGSSPTESLRFVVRGLLSARDLEIVQLVFEQRAIRIDQLARFFGLSSPIAAAAVERLVGLHLLAQAQIVPDTPNWVLSTGVGTYVVSPALGKRQFGTKAPTPRFLPHFLALNEIRLKYAKAHPDARWISERMLYVEGWSGRRPDGVVVIDGEYRAIEAELSCKERWLTTGNVARLFETYEVVHYFCTPKARRQLERIQAECQWPGLLIEDVPQEA